MSQYDVIVVGGGPAGYPCAIRCAQYGLKTCLIEKEQLGGCCLNRGCIPTKALFNAARKVSKYHFGGINYNNSVNWNELINYIKTGVVSRLRTGVGMLLKANGVDYISGHCQINEPFSVSVNGQILKTKHIVIATGASTNIPEIFCSDPRIITSDTIWNLEKLPESLAIIGGGPIGCEFASILSCFGIKITIYEMMNQILPGRDREIVSILEKTFAQKGINVKTGIKINCTDEIKEEKILWATGRKPLLDSINISGLEMSEKGINVDETMKTSIDGIFAAGDVTGKWQLAYVATKQGEVAASNCAGKNETISYNNIPETIFTLPEIGLIGLTEQQALEKHMKIKTGKFPYQALGKAHTCGETTGLAKVIVDQQTQKLLGVHIIGEGATEIIHTASIAMVAGLTVEDMLKAYWSHPTFSEILMETLFVCQDIPLHIPRTKK